MFIQYLEVTRMFDIAPHTPAILSTICMEQFARTIIAMCTMLFETGPCHSFVTAILIMIDCVGNRLAGYISQSMTCQSMEPILIEHGCSVLL